MNLVNLLNPPHEIKTEIELFRLAQRNSITGVVTPIAVPSLIFLGFGKTLEAHAFTVWLALIVCTFLCGLWTYRVLHSTDLSAIPDVKSLHLWRTVNLIYLIFAGLAWGGLSIMFDSVHDTQNAALLLTYIAVVTAGGNTSAVHSYRSYFVAVAISLIIVQSYLSVGFGQQTTPIALLLLIYPLFVAKVSKSAQQTILHSIQLQFMNESLLREKEVAAQQAERERIYRDLHDDMGAKLLGLAISAQRANLPREADLARSAMQDLRDVVSRSAKPTTQLGDLIADWRAETEQRVTAAGMDLDWCIPAADYPLAVTAAAALHMSRIMRETISNIIRHSHASRIVVDLICQEDSLTLSVADNGIGVSIEKVKTGRGMNNLRTRSAALGGSISWNCAEPCGCKVVLTLSLAHLQREHAAIPV